MANVSSILIQLNYTRENISVKCGLPLEKVDELLAGRDVSSAELRALSRGLKVPLRAFAPRGSRPSALPLIRFRNTAAIDTFDPTREYLAGFLEVAAKVLPHRTHLPHWLDMLWAEPSATRQDAENTALVIRSLLYARQESDPAIGLPQRLNAIDGVILNQLPQSKYEGASLAFENYVFLFVSPRFPGRMLFTLAHELGHIVAHQSVDAWHCDMAGDIGRFRRSEESYADAFASAFLIPAEGVGQVLTRVRNHLKITADELGDIEILYLSRFFGVSFDVAAFRCELLGLLPRGGAISMAERIRKDFKSAERRADQLGLPAHQATQIDRISPAILLSAADKITDGSLSPTWLAERLRVSVEQLQQANAKFRERKAVAN